MCHEFQMMYVRDMRLNEFVILYVVRRCAWPLFLKHATGFTEIKVGERWPCSAFEVIRPWPQTMSRALLMEGLNAAKTHMTHALYTELQDFFDSKGFPSCVEGWLAMWACVAEYARNDVWRTCYRYYVYVMSIILASNGTSQTKLDTLIGVATILAPTTVLAEVCVASVQRDS
jgi:hypothetical protein